MSSYFGLITAPAWLIGLAYVGTFLIPAIALALWAPDWVERIRDHFEAVRRDA